MSDFTDAEVVVSDALSWDPMNSDSDVKMIEEQMKKLSTSKPEKPTPIPPVVSEESKVSEEKEKEPAEAEEIKNEEMEEPAFGDAEKVLPTEGEDAAMNEQAAIPLKPRKGLFKDGQGATSDGEAPRPPTALVRSRSIPPVGRNKSRSKSRVRSRTRDPEPARGRSPPRAQKGTRLMVSSGSFVAAKSRAVVATVTKSRASILRDLAAMEIDGHSLINLHLAGYYYVPTARWPTTHPRQLAACAIRMDSKVEERWACWACQIPMDKDYPQKTGKVTFCTAKEQC